MAAIFGKDQEAQQVIERYKQRIEELKEALGESRLQTQVSVAIVSESVGIFSYGSQPTIGMILNDLGFQRPLSQQGDFFHKPYISLENLSDIDGDILFLSYQSGEVGRELMEGYLSNPLWQQLNVVKNNRVYIVDVGHWYSFDALGADAILDDLFRILVDGS